jgi:ABC-type transporter Mla maintaining outer membrane lipid asymmetry permease subunit MlaE
MDSLRVLFTDPVDYLVTPRVIASMVAGPILNVLCFSMGECAVCSRLAAQCGGAFLWRGPS